MSSASFALQKAIFAALSADENIRDIVDDPPRVFDHVPRSSALPYIVVGDDRTRDWSTATEPGSEHALTIHVWSRAPGHREARVAADAVIAALNGAALAVEGHTLIDLRWLDTELAKEADGETLHARVRFRAVLEPQ
jgi:hypothetical protein